MDLRKTVHRWAWFADIALTFADYITFENRKASRFEQLSEPTIRLVEELEVEFEQLWRLVGLSCDWTYLYRTIGSDVTADMALFYPAAGLSACWSAWAE